RSVLRIARLGLEVEPARSVRGQQSERHLRACARQLTELPVQCPLASSDEAIRRVVNEIHIVPLAMSLVQLSGEREILSEIESHVSGPWDHMEKIPEHIKQRLRERMIVALKAYYQGTAPKLAEPSPQQMLRMLGVAAGAEVAPEYLPLIRDQMGINAGER